MKSRYIISICCVVSLAIRCSGSVLSVIQCYQEQDQWCWAGCSETVLRYYGTDVTQTEIAAYGTGGVNTWNYLYGHDAEHNGISMILDHFASLDADYGYYTLNQSEIESIIDDQRLFIVRWGWDGGGGHFVVGHGLEDGLVHLMDPWYGPTINDYDWVVRGSSHTWTHTLEVVSRTSYFINFESTYGISEGHPDSDLITGMDPLLPNPGDQALIQLIYAGENGVPDGPAGAGGALIGDDILLYSCIYTYDGQNYEWDAWTVGTYGIIDIPFLGDGRVYGRIFDSTNAPLGSWYYEGHVQTMNACLTSPYSSLQPEIYDLGQGELVFASNQVAELRWLAVNVIGSGSVSLADGWYPLGVNLSISAIPNENWLFMGWSGDLFGDYTTSTTNLFVDSDMSITATFSDDADGDGLSNADEVVLGTSPRLSDSDDDGQSDGDEVIAGTNPSDAGSRFDISDYEAITNNNFVIEWPSVTGRWYQVLWSSDLTNDFQVMEDFIEHPQSNYIDTIHSAEDSGFYQVNVRMK